MRHNSVVSPTQRWRVVCAECAGRRLDLPSTSSQQGRRSGQDLWARWVGPVGPRGRAGAAGRPSAGRLGERCQPEISARSVNSAVTTSAPISHAATTSSAVFGLEPSEPAAPPPPTAHAAGRRHDRGRGVERQVLDDVGQEDRGELLAEVDARSRRRSRRAGCGRAWRSRTRARPPRRCASQPRPSSSGSWPSVVGSPRPLGRDAGEARADDRHDDADRERHERARRRASPRSRRTTRAGSGSGSRRERRRP